MLRKAPNARSMPTATRECVHSGQHDLIGTQTWCPGGNGTIELRIGDTGTVVPQLSFLPGLLSPIPRQVPRLRANHSPLLQHGADYDKFHPRVQAGLCSIGRQLVRLGPAILRFEGFPTLRIQQKIGISSSCHT